jgi:hypothetical protein
MDKMKGENSPARDLLNPLGKNFCKEGGYSDGDFTHSDVAGSCLRHYLWRVAARDPWALFHPHEGSDLSQNPRPGKRFPRLYRPLAAWRAPEESYHMFLVD